MMENKTPILIFSTAYHPYIGGAEVAIAEITNRVPDAEFHLIASQFDPKLPREEQIGRVTVHRVGLGKSWDKYVYPLFAYFKAIDLHQQHQFKIIWAMMANLAGFAALLFKWSYQIKYLLTLQEGDSEEFLIKRTWWWRPLYKQIYKRADKIQAISKWLEERARNYEYQGQVDLVPNGVDLEKFTRKLTEAESRKQKAELGILPDDKVIITVSRLVTKNGVGDLVEAMEFLPDDYKLLVLGDGELKENLEVRSKKLEVADRVKFLGSIPNNQVYKYLNISDVFCRPSLSEGFGNVFVEAMAADLPVIATLVGGIKDFLIDGETGLVCEVNNPQSIAEQVKRLTVDENLRQKLITNGQKLVKEKYNWDVIGEQMSKIFYEL